LSHNEQVGEVDVYDAVLGKEVVVSLGLVAADVVAGDIDLVAFELYWPNVRIGITGACSRPVSPRCIAMRCCMPSRQWEGGCSPYAAVTSPPRPVVRPVAAQQAFL